MFRIVCPKLGRSVPTGVLADELAFEKLAADKTKLKCPACGEIHDWTSTEAPLPIDARIRDPINR
jgi:hypothetical protein